MKSFLQALLIFLCFLATGAALFWKWSDHKVPEPSNGGGEKKSPLTEQPPPTSTRDFSPSAKADLPAEIVTKDQDLRAWLEFFQSAPNPQAARSALADLRRWFESIPPRDALDLLESWFRESPDLLTGLEFVVGPEGRLRSSSTWKTFLLDQIAGLEPERALQLAVEAFSEAEMPAHAALFSLHLGHYGRYGQGLPGWKNTLLQQWERLSQHEPWVNQPENGFLESLDVLVATQARQESQILLDWLGKDETPRLQRAAAIAVDRLLLEPGGLEFEDLDRVDQLSSIPSGFRAPLLARANASSEADRKALETYLLDLNLPRDEKERFYRGFPNLNLRLIHGLISEPVQLSHKEAVSRLKSAQALLDSWQRDPRFQADQALIQEALQNIQRRSGNPTPP